MVRKEKESYPFEPVARFLRVQLEESSHPYFNRVWHARHILDQDSPLVSVEARNRIRNNGGFWPEDLNNPESVRHHLRFSSVILIMTGISNISAESVQISKRYYKDDVLIGYDCINFEIRFVKIMIPCSWYRNSCKQDGTAGLEWLL